MQDVPQIKAAYDWLIEAYQREVMTLMTNGNRLAVESLDEKRDMLERGVFVLLFGQFEKFVAEKFERERDTRLTNPDWTTRRGWDVPAHQGRRVPFETKLALVFDRQDSNHSKIIDAYARRNHCAHGGTTLAVGSIDQFANDLYVWQASINRQ